MLLRPVIPALLRPFHISVRVMRHRKSPLKHQIHLDTFLYKSGYSNPIFYYTAYHIRQIGAIHAPKKPQKGYVGVTGVRGGYVFFLFRRKERTKEKSVMSFSRKYILVRAFLGELYIGRCVYFLSLRCLALESAAFSRSLVSVAHANYNLYSFRDSANGRFPV